MKAEYKGGVFDVGSVDFEESLVGLHEVIPNLDEITWVRCENISLHNAGVLAQPGEISTNTNDAQS